MSAGSMILDIIVLASQEYKMKTLGFSGFGVQGSGGFKF